MDPESGEQEANLGTLAIPRDSAQLRQPSRVASPGPLFVRLAFAKTARIEVGALAVVGDQVAVESEIVAPLETAGSQAKERSLEREAPALQH